MKIFEVDEELIGNKYKSNKSAEENNNNKNNSTNQKINVKNHTALADRNSALDDISILAARKSNSKDIMDKSKSNNDFDEISTGRNNNLSDKFIDNLDEIINTKISTFSYFY